MLSSEIVAFFKKVRFKNNFEMRAIAAYYARKSDVHPDPSMANTFYVPKDSKSQKSELLQYVRLADGNQTLAVFRITHESRLKRLKRWPRSIDDSTAVTRAMLERWYSDYDDELDDLLDELDAVMPHNGDSGEAIRHGFASEAQTKNDLKRLAKPSFDEMPADEDSVARA